LTKLITLQNNGKVVPVPRHYSVNVQGVAMKF